MKATKSKLEEEIHAKQVQNKFESLCDNISSQKQSWSKCLSNILNLKNELLQHSMPPALMLKLTVAHSELFRSQMDLLAPVEELVRLVSVYKQSLEDKSIALKRIDEDNERRRIELDIAVKKLEQSYSYEKQWRRDHTLNNWERMFCKASLNRTHGRRWKFVINKVRQRADLGLSVFNPLVGGIGDDEDMDIDVGGRIAPRFTYGSTTNSSAGFTKQSGMLSTYNTPSAISTKQSTRQTSTTRQSSLMSSSLKMDTSGETEDETESSEPMPAKHVNTRSPMSYKSPASSAKKTNDANDKCVSTEDPVYDTLLDIQIYNPIGMKSVEFEKISCKLSLLGETQECGVIDDTEEGSFEWMSFLFDSDEHKRLGFKRGTSLGALLEEEDVTEQLEITVHSGEEKKIFAVCSIPIEDLSDTQPEINSKIDPDDVVPKPFPMYSLEGDVTAPCGYLPIFCVWKLTKRERFISVAANTDQELYYDDYDCQLPEDTSHTKVTSSSPALSRKSVSVMIPTPKPPDSESNTPEPFLDESPKSGDESKRKEDQVRILTEACEVARTQAQEMTIAHAQEIERLHYEYEIRLEGMAKALEMLKLERIDNNEAEYSGTPISLVSCFSSATRPSSTGEIMHANVPSVSIRQRSAATATPDARKRKSKTKVPLTADFFQRMDYFVQSSIAKQHELVSRVKDEVQAHAEGAMATQHRLARRTPAMESPDSGINEATQDLSLPAIFMPCKTGVVFSPKAGRYFHPPGSKEPRLTQAPSVFQLPHMSKVPVLNLFDLSQKDVVQNGPGWLYKTCKDVTKRSL